MELFIGFLKRIFVYLIVVALSITLLLVILDYKVYALGWLWGCGMNCLYLIALGLWVHRVRHKSLKTIEKATKLGSAIRLGLVAIGTLAAAILFDHFSFVAYILGLLVWRPLTIIGQIRHNAQHGWKASI